MKILYVTTVGATMTFFRDFIRELTREGHSVDIATNDSVRKVPECYNEYGCRVFSLPCSRSPLNKGNLEAIGQIRRLVEQEKYDIVHCHTPVAAACTRIACRKFRKAWGLKVFYTAHGFHFYKGAPLKNWVIFYPVEKLCSYFTDKLITINHEDYDLAKRKMKAKEVRYVPGVGIDLSRFENVQVDRAAKRREIGVPEDAVLLMSVGELNENKNHQVIIRALAKLNDPSVHYAVAGQGSKRDALLELANALGVSDQVHLLGFRNDIPELNHAADAFCLPSHREGLGLSAIEAMACGLPIITSNVHGINDYSTDGVTGYKCAPTDVDGFSNAVGKLINDGHLRMKMGQDNRLLAKKYEVNAINPTLKNIYGL
jgi:glycosyltransferase involved in cell wall biosynthesis